VKITGATQGLSAESGGGVLAQVVDEHYRQLVSSLKLAQFPSRRPCRRRSFRPNGVSGPGVEKQQSGPQAIEGRPQARAIEFRVQTQAWYAEQEQIECAKREAACGGDGKQSFVQLCGAVLGRVGEHGSGVGTGKRPSASAPEATATASSRASQVLQDLGVPPITPTASVAHSPSISHLLLASTLGRSAARTTGGAWAGGGWRGHRWRSFRCPPFFLLFFGLAAPVALAFDRDDLRVVGEPVDQGDGAAGVGKMVFQSEKARLVVRTTGRRS